jgi:glutathione S-transferase
MTHQPQLTLCEFPETGLPDVESYSPFCLKVHRALRVHGLSYDSRRMANPDRTKSINPARQLPVLLVDGRPIPDSTRILAELERISNAPLHAGLSPRLKADALLWEEFADTVLNGFLVAARWADDENWPGVKETYFKDMPRVIRAIVPRFLRRRTLKMLRSRDVTRAGMKACWDRFELTLDQLEERAPDSGFWVSEGLTAADLSIFAQLHSLRTSLTMRQSNAIDRRLRLSAYLDRVHRATRRVSVKPLLTTRAA